LSAVSTWVPGDELTNMFSRTVEFLARSALLVCGSVQRSNATSSRSAEQVSRLRWLAEVEAMVSKARAGEARVDALQLALEQASLQLESRSRQIACLEDEVDGAERLLEFFTATRSTGNPVSTLRDAVCVARVCDPDTSVKPNVELFDLELKAALDKSLSARASLEAKLEVTANERETLRQELAHLAFERQRERASMCKKEACLNSQLLAMHQLLRVADIDQDAMKVEKVNGRPVGRAMPITLRYDVKRSRRTKSARKRGVSVSSRCSSRGGDVYTPAVRRRASARN